MLHKKQLFKYNSLIWIIHCIDCFICVRKLLKSICGHIDCHISFIFIFGIKAAFKLHGSNHYRVGDVIHTILEVSIQFFGVSSVLSLLKCFSCFFWCLFSLIFWCVLICCVVASVILIGITLSYVFVCLILL